MSPKPRFFKTPPDLRKWFATNHETADELILGYWKKATGKPSVDWSESVDQALCFGWIDGIRRKIDDERYCIRFTPRKPKSHWSNVNIRSVERLTRLGLMMPAGIAAFERMDPNNSAKASHEQTKVAKLDPAYESKLKANQDAWNHFAGLAPSYKKATIHWVMSAKKEETRLRRLDVLMESSVQGLKIPTLRRK